MAIADENRADWIENTAHLLIESQFDEVIEEIMLCKMNSQNTKAQNTLLNYLKTNRFRMDYKKYRKMGWLIGSGPIEAAQRTLVQQRLKLPGQRWSIKKAQNVLNLRACQMSNQWQTIINKCTYPDNVFYYNYLIINKLHRHFHTFINLFVLKNEMFYSKK